MSSLVGALVARSEFLSNLYNSYKSTNGTTPVGPAWLLGREYAAVLPETDPVAAAQVPNEAPASAGPTPDELAQQAFMKDFQSILWFTYRRGFDAIVPSDYTSDAGWGCMLRTGQMLLARGLLLHFLGRDWRYGDGELPEAYWKVLRWFQDAPCAAGPYSIHYIAQTGHRYSKRIGEWFGPTTIAQVLKHLVRQHAPGGATLYVGQDGVLYEDQIADLCTGRADPTGMESPIHESPFERDPAPAPQPSSSTWWGRSAPKDVVEPPVPVPEVVKDAPQPTPEWRPLIILLPLRLGLQKVNDVYIPTLKAFLSMPQTLGIAGGKPRASLYFVGFQEDAIFYLDPHRVETAFNMGGTFPSESFHCGAPRKLAWNDVDPSLCLGFYCRDRDDFTSLCAAIRRLNEGTSTPLVTVAAHAPAYMQEPAAGAAASTAPRATSKPAAGAAPTTGDMEGSDDDFEIL